MNGSPEANPDKLSFTDVPAKEYFAKPVAWAFEKKVTEGTSATSFSPEQNCTRAQFVTFLWSLAGKPDTAKAAFFADVSADAYYAKAVSWAAEKGITSGTSKTSFSPEASCTRGQAVTLLYGYSKAHH